MTSEPPKTLSEVAKKGMDENKELMKRLAKM
jgi:hypothetical protein